MPKRHDTKFTHPTIQGRHEPVDDDDGGDEEVDDHPRCRRQVY